MDRVQQSQGDTVDLEDGDEELLDLIWDAFAHEEERDAEEEGDGDDADNEAEGKKSLPFVGSRTKFNPNHGLDGRFTSGHGGGGGHADTKPPLDLGTAPAEEQDGYYAKMSGGWKDGLTDRQKEAIQNYTSHGYGSINACSRGQWGCTRRGKEDAEILATALDGATVKEPVVVYRGLTRLKDLGLSEKTVDGAVIKDRGFMSTALDFESAQLFTRYMSNSAVMRITVPKGAKAAALHGVSYWGGEMEILIQQGSSLRINGHSRDKDRNLILDAEVVL